MTMTVRVNRPILTPGQDDRRPIARPAVDSRLFGGWGPKF